MKDFKKIRQMAIMPCILLLAAMICGCGVQFNRDLEDALGPAAREKVQNIGSPDKNCALYKLAITHSYGIVIGNKIIRLGEEYPSVNIVSQFATGNVDNAVVQCIRTNGMLDNYLLQVGPGQNGSLYQLSSTSRQPFSSHVTKDGTILLQTTDRPGTVTVWGIAPGDVRGPIQSKVNEVKNSSKKKSRKASSQAKAMPRIKKDDAFRLEADKPQSSSTAAPAPKEQEAPYKAIETPQLD